MVFFVYSGWLGVIYDYQVTNRRAPEGLGVLAGSPPCFLLVIMELHMITSCTATHFFEAIQIRVNNQLESCRDLRKVLLCNRVG